MSELLRSQNNGITCHMPNVAGALVGLMLFLPALAFGAVTKPWNATLPTLGGKQVWQDTHIRFGWRVQRNLLTGHFRLLDPKDLRRAWGTYAHCVERLNQFDNIGDIQGRGPHLVLMVHGIGRSTGTFRHLEKALLLAGYDAVAVTYPSTRGSIADHAAAIDLMLDRMETAETVSFVSHSMGGLVLRHLMASNGRWQRRIRVGRTVMIAPPNQGSAIAEAMKDVNSYQWVFGAAGQELTRSHAPSLPAYEHEFGVIAGGTGSNRGFNPLLDGDNDGTVRTAETHLEGAIDTTVVRSSHTFLAGHPETVQATLNFLSNGEF